MILGIVLLLGRVSIDRWSTGASLNQWQDTSGSFATYWVIPAYVLTLLAIMLHASRAYKVIIKLWPFLLFIIFTLLAEFILYRSTYAIKYTAHMLGMLLIATTTALACVNDRNKFYAVVHLSTIAVVFASFIVALLYPKYGVSYFGDIGMLVRRWRGVTTSPNSLGTICVAAFCSGMIWRNTITSFAGRAFLLASSSFALLVVARGAQSMTSTMSCLATLFLLFLFSKRGKLGVLRFSKFTTLAICVFSALVVLFSAGTVVFILGRNLTFSGRIYLWEYGMDLFMQKAVFGWGLDFEKYMSGAFFREFVNFHNGFLEMLVRGGIVRLMLVFLCLIAFLRSAIKIIKLDSMAAATSIIFFASMLVTNMTESSFFRPFDPQWVIVMCIWALNEYALKLNKETVTHNV